MEVSRWVSSKEWLSRCPRRRRSSIQVSGLKLTDRASEAPHRVQHIGAGVTVGLFEQTITIALFGENASGFHSALGSFDVTLRADVACVPVPAAWLFARGLAALAARRRDAPREGQDLGLFAAAKGLRNPRRRVRCQCRGPAERHLQPRRPALRRHLRRFG
jgi:hypothetical protein